MTNRHSNDTSMMYLAIIFISPMYFLLRGKWLSLLLNATLYGLACLMLISFIGAFIAPLFWALAVGHAGWHLRKELMQEQANMIARAIHQAGPATTVAALVLAMLPGPAFAAPMAESDAYEPDNSRARSTLLRVNQLQQHSIGNPGDRDWAVFKAQGNTPGGMYTLQVTTTSTPLRFDVWTDTGTGMWQHQTQTIPAHRTVQLGHMIAYGPPMNAVSPKYWFKVTSATPGATNHYALRIKRIYGPPN